MKRSEILSEIFGALFNVSSGPTFGQMQWRHAFGFWKLLAALLVGTGMCICTGCALERGSISVSYRDDGKNAAAEVELSTSSSYVGKMKR